jgi:hypothetical protein
MTVSLINISFSSCLYAFCSIRRSFRLAFPGLYLFAGNFLFVPHFVFHSTVPCHYVFLLPSLSNTALAMRIADASQSLPPSAAHVLNLPFAVRTHFFFWESFRPFLCLSTSSIVHGIMCPHLPDNMLNQLHCPQAVDKPGIKIFRCATRRKKAFDIPVFYPRYLVDNITPRLRAVPKKFCQPLHPGRPVVLAGH